MVSTNCKPEIAIVYTSVTGNTWAVAEILAERLQARGCVPAVYRVSDFKLDELYRYDIVIVGTYTWGNGEIPAEMRSMFEAFERLGRPELVTAVFGTGDSIFAEFCGAVNRFRDMLFVHTDLAATLKIELMAQEKDFVRCEKFADIILGKCQRILVSQ